MRATCRSTDCTRRIRKNGLCFAHLRRGEDATVARRLPTRSDERPGERRCSACQEWLPLASFTKDSRSTDGRRSTCLECHRARRRVAKFGVTVDWFDETLAAQDGCCAICKSPEPRGRGWAIDHDHGCCPDPGKSCGACVRGILCNPCNLALGLLGDRVDVLNVAAAYLEDRRLSIEPERMSMVRGV